MKESFYEDLMHYKNLKVYVETIMDNVCRKYFETYEPDWQYYSGWSFGENDTIHLEYIYYSDVIGENTEWDYTSIDIKTLLEKYNKIL